MTSLGIPRRSYPEAPELFSKVYGLDVEGSYEGSIGFHKGFYARGFKPQPQTLKQTM